LPDGTRHHGHTPVCEVISHGSFHIQLLLISGIEGKIKQAEKQLYEPNSSENEFLSYTPNDQLNKRFAKIAYFYRQFNQTT